MPSSNKPDLLLDKVMKAFEREAKGLADLGVSMFFDALKQRLAQSRTSNEEPASVASPYQVLGVAPEASMEEVRKAFRQKVHEFHPDLEGGDEGKLREVLDAMDQIRKAQGN